MLYNLHFSFSKCRLFHNATLFGFCITHILNTGCAKIWRKKIRRQKVKNEWNYKSIHPTYTYDVQKEGFYTPLDYKIKCVTNLGIQMTVQMYT